MSNTSQVFGVIGAVVGGVATGVVTGGMGAVQGAALGYSIGSTVGSYVDPTVTRGPRITDATAQTTTVGGAITRGYGVFYAAGQLIWTSDLKETKKTSSSSGKGGSSKTVTYTYTRSYAIGICEGPIHEILWVKKNSKLMYAAYPSDLGEQLGYTASEISALTTASTNFLKKNTFYLGTSTQMPDSTIVAVEGAGNVSPFRDIAYIVCEAIDLTDEYGAIPTYEFCVNATVPDVYVTSQPYSLEFSDNMQATSMEAKDAPASFDDYMDAASITASSGRLSEVITTYSSWPQENMDAASITISDGTLREVIATYSSWPQENMDAATIVVSDGTLRVVLYTYGNWPQENMDAASITPGTGTLA